MEITIESKKLNPLILREKIEAIAEIAEGETTPSMAYSKKVIAEKLNKSADLIIIKKVDHPFGENRARITAYVYDNAEALKKFEPPEKKKGEKKEKKAAVKKKEE